MTIQRQYSLPNCTLLLEGLGDLSLMSQSETRPLMSVLINAECHLPGQEKPLTGGREFLESLVTAVSQYAQEILSDMRGVRAAKPGTGLVQLERLDDTHHRLSVLPEGATPGSGIAAQLTRQIDLSTVQLFDLVEAVDQFFADSQTLPDLGLNLKPVSRRFRSSQAISKQTVPAALGLSSVAIAAIALFAVPIPKVSQPDCLRPGEAGCTTNPNAGKSPSPTLSPGASPAPSSSPQSKASPAPSPPNQTAMETTLNGSPEISDPKEIQTLQDKLRQQIDDAWKTRTAVTQDLVYRVGVIQDGAIAGYKPVNPAAVTNASKTPLLDLLRLPAAGGNQPTSEPLAQYKVVFTSSGVVEVAPWKEAMATPLAKNGGSEITDNKRLEALLDKLQTQIYDNSKDLKPSYGKELIFRVRVKEDGTVVDYKPDNQTAYDYVQETPLPKLGKPADEGSGSLDVSHAIFKVVFKPGGVAEINPWRGWQPE